MNITEDDVERALNYLRDTAKDYAMWRGRMLATEYLIKMTEAKEFLDVETGAQEYKKNVARASAAYKKAVDEHEEATVRYTELQSLRKAAELKISAYQSLVKSHSQGLNI
jgi:hypothetical protein